MQVTDIYLGLGRDRFDQLLRSVSIGRLKTFQLFDRMKTRLHLVKLNSESLRKAAPRIWTRIVEERDEDFTAELSQAILISHFEMIKAVLDQLGIPHEDGFFSKDADLAGMLTEGWQQRAWEAFRETYPPAALLFYINHLGWEVANAEQVFAPAA
ncbi:MAG: hypothetical protein ABI811_15705 [Acidobacteriota bacterium]